MEELKKPDKKPHRVTIEGRERITVSSVEDMDSFNENEAIFLTGEGMMTVTGGDLHVNRLDLTEGVIVIDGLIEAIDYADHEEQRLGKGGLIKRVFR